MQDMPEKYRDRLKRVVTYINGNLDSRLDLDELAEIACLSRYHWHRIYRGLTGETIHATVSRLKLNRASGALKESKTPISASAASAGYRTTESFSRAFKIQFGMTPAAFRASEDTFPRLSTLQLESMIMHLQTENLEVDIRNIPSIRLAALKSAGPYNGNPIFTKLFKQGMKQHIEVGPERMVGIYYDDPAVIPAPEQRMIAGIKVAPDFEPTAPLEIFHTHTGPYAVFRYKGPYEKLDKVHDWIFGTWFTSHDHEPADHPLVEIFVNTPDRTVPEDLLTDICVPLKD